MTDSRFAPFEPRRRTRPVENLAQSIDAEKSPPQDEPALVISDLPASKPARQSSDAFADTTAPACKRCATRAFGDDGIDPRLIRAAAIPLAAAACTRALRYAIDRNPRLIARFVDDALAAAGAAARRATIRLATDCVAAFEPDPAHAVIADDELGIGDVFIDTTAGAIGARLEERAALLVRAAAG